MRSNKFVKKFGVVQSKYHLSFMLSDCQPLVLCDCILSTKEVGNLKRLIKSHDLVERYGGLEEANRVVCNAYKGSNYEIPKGHEELSLAIQDVESCM